MKRCVVIAAAPGLRPEWLAAQVEADDYIICADGGYLAALQAGIRPDRILGDFDSAPKPEGAETFPREKDDTDTGLALEAGMELGYREFLILGGIGSRLDHTFANITCLRRLLERGCRGELREERNRVTLLRNGSVRLPRREGWVLSVFSMDLTAHGVTLEGVKYPLYDAELSQCPLGVSNEITGETALITVKNGTLLLILAKD